MKHFTWSDLTEASKLKALARPEGLSDISVYEAVSNIMAKVKTGGDEAVSELTAKFDGVKPASLRVSTAELETAWRTLPKAQRDAINIAKKNIETFHNCLLYTSPSPRDRQKSRMPSSA